MARAGHGVVEGRTRACGARLVGLLPLRAAFCLVMCFFSFALPPSRRLGTPLRPVCFAFLELGRFRVCALAQLARLYGFLSL